jgi:hypothetical protein
MHAVELKLDIAYPGIGVVGEYADRKCCRRRKKGIVGRRGDADARRCIRIGTDDDRDRRAAPLCPSESTIVAVPEAPTIRESVLPGFEASVWYGILAPAKTPQPVVEKLAQVFKASISDPKSRNG